QSEEIQWAHLIRPMAVTHSDDTSQRLVDLSIRSRDVCHLRVSVTDKPNLAPPGWDLLFLCDRSGGPSTARWISLDRRGSVRALALNVRIPQKHMRPHDHNPGFVIPGLPRKGHHDEEMG